MQRHTTNMKQIALILIILLSGFTNGFACRCNHQNLKNEIDSCDLIFQGIPIDKKQVDSKMIYRFFVDKVWKGDEIDTLEIKTGLGGQDCGMIFEIGKAYVVFAKNGETSHCRKNDLIDSTFTDLKLDYKFISKYSETSFNSTEKVLTDNECRYLNEQFKGFIEDYDFSEKSIIFTSNREVISKQEWFDRFWHYDRPVAYIVELTDSEKQKTGYDAILVTYCKMMITDKMKKKILEQL